MSMLAATLAVAAPLVLADEKSFLHFPGVDDFRVQKVQRADREDEWPFTVDEGYLTCAYLLGKPTVYFTDNPGEGGAIEDMRVVVVSTDPMDLMLARFVGQGLIGSFASMETLIKLMAPLKTVGNRLCDQPRGTIIGPGEL
jgi:hypothetical protein